jgi:hypothetical protein
MGLSAIFLPLLRKFLANCLAYTHPTMASADYRSGIPVLPATPPQTETTADGLDWLLHAQCRLGGTKVAVGRRQPPWSRSASGGSFC